MRKFTITLLAIFAIVLSANAAADPEVKEVKKTVVAITIDGEIDAVWADAMGGDINKRWLPVEGELAPENCSGAWKMLYDDNNLYLLIEVVDDVLVNDGEDMNEHDDGWDIVFDLLNGKIEDALNNVDDADKLDYRMLWGNYSASGVPEINEEAKWSFTALGASVDAACLDVTGGYVIEFAIDIEGLWADGVSAEQEFGLGVRLNDDDAGGDRENMAAWDQDRDDEEADGWNTPSTWGTAKFVATEVPAVSGLSNQINSTFTVYPNPVSDVLHITNIEMGDQISIVNTLGQEVFSAIAKEGTFEANMSELTTGVYLVKVGNSTQKVIIN